MSYFADVERFHRKFQLPEAWELRRCAPMSAADYEYRLKFLEEELAEFRDAVTEGNLAKQLDALVDLVYVALGTAHYLGAPFESAWNAVQSANMAKVLRTEVDPIHKRGVCEVISKPPGWTPPDIAKVIEDYNVLCLRINP